MDAGGITMKATDFWVLPVLVLAACVTTAGNEADGGPSADGGEVSASPHTPGAALQVARPQAQPQRIQRQSAQRQPVAALEAVVTPEQALRSPWLRATVTDAITAGTASMRALQAAVDQTRTGPQALADDVAVLVASLRAAGSYEQDVGATVSFLAEATGAAIGRGMEAEVQRNLLYTKTIFGLAGAMCGDGMDQPCDEPAHGVSTSMP